MKVEWMEDDTGDKGLNPMNNERLLVGLLAKLFVCVFVPCHIIIMNENADENRTGFFLRGPA